MLHSIFNLHKIGCVGLSNHYCSMRMVLPLLSEGGGSRVRLRDKHEITLIHRQNVV
jgi:hypothetical protein